MNSTKRTLRNKLLHLLLPLLALTPFASPGAPGTLTNSPLFLSTAVEPNVFFLLDDSGSMEWEELVKGGSSGLPYLDGYYTNYMFPSANNGEDQYYISYSPSCTSSGRIGCFPYVTPSDAAVPGAWRARNSSYNSLYYNPAITYKPWPGTDSLGNALYSNSTPSAAPVDPNNASAGTFDLTSNVSFYNYRASVGWYIETIFPAKYYTWTDTNGNGVVDASDAHTLVEIKPSTTTYTGSADRSDCAAAPTCTYAEEIQNFANWYTYYRKRAYMAKGAIGDVINGSDKKRMGLQLYNYGLVRNAATMSTASNKRNLLQDLYGANIHCDNTGCPGTPARNALKSVGSLFEGSTSPILSAANGGACQQNFDVIITDGYWNGGDPDVGNTDGDNNTAFDSDSSGYKSGTKVGYGDPYSNTLADVAMQYYENDLKSTLPDDVPTIPGVDDATHQHLVTFSVALGLTGTLDPTTDDPTSAGFSWPDPITNSGDQRVDDLWHAAFDGRGKFYSAQNPQELSDGLKNALASISDRTGSAAAVTFNTSTLGTNSAVYVALFNSDGWSGDLVSYPLDPVTGDVGSTPNWKAANVLDSRDIGTSPRVMLTYDGTNGIPFEWTDLTSAEQADLRTNPGGGTDSAAVGQARLNFIRGDRSNEGTGLSFRVRQSRLGDIVHSAPVFLGTPAVAWPDTAPFPTTTGQRFSDFRQANLTRDGIIYVGTNDGMLHAFREDTGEEVLTYVPSNLFSNSTAAGLHFLTDPAYTHRYYVDLSTTVTPAYVKTTTGGTAAWHSILIGGERGGGRGLFALDVTDPTAFSESNAANLVLWEFTSADDADLGYTFSQPTIARMNNGRWAAIFGNGYNDSGSGHAQLFIVYLDGGLDGTWTINSDYVKLDTQAGSTANPNGLSTPAVVDVDGNGTADRVYAGDLEGHMWAFDVSKSNASQWGPVTSGGSPVPLFTAASNQPITVKPEVATNPLLATTNSNSPNLLVLFGTGQYLVNADKTSTDMQSIYGVWDSGTMNLTRADLVAQTVEPGFPTGTRVLTDNPVPYTASGTSQRFGWYFDLPESGERLVTDPVLRGDYLYYNTWIPSSDPCSYGGSSWTMAVNYANGGRPDAPAFDYNNDGRISNLDLVSSTSLSNVAVAGTKRSTLVNSPRFLGDYKYESDTGGRKPKKTRVPHMSGLNTGRLSWRELGR